MPGLPLDGLLFAAMPAGRRRPAPVRVFRPEDATVCGAGRQSASRAHAGGRADVAARCTGAALVGVAVRVVSTTKSESIRCE